MPNRNENNIILDREVMRVLTALSTYALTYRDENGASVVGNAVYVKGGFLLTAADNLPEEEGQVFSVRNGKTIVHIDDERTVFIDPRTGLALIEVLELIDLPSLPLAPSMVEIGQPLTALVSSPYGARPLVTNVTCTDIFLPPRLSSNPFAQYDYLSDNRLKASYNPYTSPFGRLQMSGSPIISAEGLVGITDLGNSEMFEPVGISLTPTQRTLHSQSIFARSITDLTGNPVMGYLLD